MGKENNYLKKIKNKIFNYYSDIISFLKKKWNYIKPLDIKSNYPYCYLFYLEISYDYKNICKFFINIYHLNIILYNYIVDIKRVIVDFILLIFGILPLILIIKSLICIYRKLMIYLFIIFDAIFLDFILRNNEIYCYRYKKCRDILYIMFYDLWFTYSIKDLIYFSKRLHIWTNFVQIINRFFSLLFSPIKLLFKFAAFIETSFIPNIERKFREFRINIKKKLKDFFYISLKKWFKRKFKRFKRKFKRVIKYYFYFSISFYKYLPKRLRWHYRINKKKIKIYIRLHYRWFRRWLKIGFSWYFTVIKVYFVSINLKLLDIYFTIFDTTKREYKIKNLTNFFCIIFDYWLINIDEYLVNIYNWYFNIISKIIYFLYKFNQYKGYIKYRWMLFSCDIHILYSRFKLLLLKLKILIINLFPYRLTHFFKFLFDNIFRQRRERKLRENLDYRYNMLLKKLIPINFFNKYFTIFGLKLFDIDYLYKKYVINKPYVISFKLYDKINIKNFFRKISTILVIIEILLVYIILNIIIILLLYLILSYTFATIFL